MENKVDNLEAALSMFIRKNNLITESYSGGATQIPFLAGVGIGIREANPEYNPDLLTGISSGACTALMLALGKTSKLQEIVLHLQLSTFFSCSPVNKEGNLTIQSSLRGVTKGSLGSMDNLRDLIRQTITETEYKIYKHSENTPAVIIGITSMNKANGFKLVNLKTISYNQMIEVIVASASIPVYTESVVMNGEHFFDGGLMYHNAGRIVLEYLNERISKYISVYSRPEFDNKYDSKYNGKKIMRTLSKTIDQLQRVISQNDAIDEVRLSRAYQTPYFKQVFSEKIMKGLYDVDSQRLLQLFELGKERGNFII